MYYRTLVSAVLGTLLALSAAMPANAAMVRAFWAGTIEQAAGGDDMALAVGDVIVAHAQVDSTLVASMVNGGASISADAAFYSVDDLVALRPASSTPDFYGRIQLSAARTWSAIDASGTVVASGSWSADDIKFEPRVIPVPAALPLMLGALGLLGGLRRR